MRWGRGIPAIISPGNQRFFNSSEVECQSPASKQAWYAAGLGFSFQPCRGKPQALGQLLQGNERSGFHTPMIGAESAFPSPKTEASRLCAHRRA